MTIFLGLDPGTYCTGAALFSEGELVDAKLIRADRKLPIESRVPIILERLEMMAHQGYPLIQDVACEWVTGYENKRPAPELQVLLRRIRGWATHRGLGFYAYHPSTVAAAVRPRGLSGSAKDAIRMGVQMLYGKEAADLDQNILDAIAVGVAHMNHLRESRITYWVGDGTR